METLTQEHSEVWIQGLMTVAWSDGHLDDCEQELITEILHNENNVSHPTEFVPISLETLKRCFAGDKNASENFLKTAVMVALADGIYSSQEDELLQTFCNALEIDPPVLAHLRSTLDGKEQELPSGLRPPKPGKSALGPVKEWLDSVEIEDPKVARFLCKLIPADCPFERDVVLFGKKIVHIPPMCKINPLYEQLVGLRFRSLSFLADKCKEDVSAYL